MALTDIKHPPASTSLFQRLRGRAKDWLTAEHSLTQRMAGTAFAIRVASAAIMFGSQVLLARWMGQHEFGTYVYVWTWLLLVGESSMSGCRSPRSASFPNTSKAARSICCAAI